jgi:hypothetical protein
MINDRPIDDPKLQRELIERLRAALREIANLTHGNSSWAPGMAMRALGGHYEHAGI